MRWRRRIKPLVLDVPSARHLATVVSLTGYAAVVQTPEHELVVVWAPSQLQAGWKVLDTFGDAAEAEFKLAEATS